jgi:hypothetical protein
MDLETVRREVLDVASTLGGAGFGERRDVIAQSARRLHLVAFGIGPPAAPKPGDGKQPMLYEPKFGSTTECFVCGELRSNFKLRAIASVEVRFGIESEFANRLFEPLVSVECLNCGWMRVEKAKGAS